MKLRHFHHWTFDKLICAIGIICLAVVLILVLKDSLRTYFKSLSLSWSLGVKSLSLSLGGQVQEVLVLVLGVRSLFLSWSLGVRSLLTSLLKCASIPNDLSRTCVGPHEHHSSSQQWRFYECWIGVTEFSLEEFWKLSCWKHFCTRDAPVN